MRLFPSRKSPPAREPIRLLALRHGYFPRRFSWRGRNYAIDAVERAWTETRSGGVVEGYRFRVRCAEGTFELLQEAASKRWYLVKGRAS